MLDAEIADFFRGFRQHCDAVGDAPAFSASNELLRFYAIECGLKFLYLKASGKRRWFEIPEAQRFGHDLSEGCRLARIPFTGGLTRVRLPGIPGSRIAPKHIHEALRYGIRLKDNEGCRNGLTALLKVN